MRPVIGHFSFVRPHQLPLDTLGQLVVRGLHFQLFPAPYDLHHLFKRIGRHGARFHIGAQPPDLGFVLLQIGSCQGDDPFRIVVPDFLAGGTDELLRARAKPPACGPPLHRSTSACSRKWLGTSGKSLFLWAHAASHRDLAWDVPFLCTMSCSVCLVSCSFETPSSVRALFPMSHGVTHNGRCPRCYFNSLIISIAPQGHSSAQSPQPLQ